MNSPQNITITQDRLDPIDWATYEPHLWANAAHFYQRTSTLLGLLTQLQRPQAHDVGGASQKVRPGGGGGWSVHSVSKNL